MGQTREQGEQVVQAEGTTVDGVAQDYVVFGVPGVGYSSVKVHISEDREVTAEAIRRAIGIAKFVRAEFDKAFPDANEAAEREKAAAMTRGPQRPRGGRPAPQGGRGQGETRASKYPQLDIDDWQCDMCGGPCGRYPKTGAMRSDKAVCLGRCKDGQYVHTVGWLDEDEPGDDEPF